MGLHTRDAERPYYERLGEAHICVDLDGTLAVEGTVRFTDIGPPVPAMLARVKDWIRAGIRVKIFTARADGLNDGVPDPAFEADQVRRITDWCNIYGLHYPDGTSLEVTCRKDMNTVSLWDNRAVSVQTNTGWVEDANRYRSSYGATPKYDNEYYQPDDGAKTRTIYPTRTLAEPTGIPDPPEVSFGSFDYYRNLGISTAVLRDSIQKFKERGHLSPPRQEEA